jgi:GNAT superfamily N-acetyltransferase
MAGMPENAQLVAARKLYEANVSGVRQCCGVALATRTLDSSTWHLFEELVERNNGIYGGCWCIAYHPEYRKGVSDPRSLKHELVRSGRAQAALVIDERGRAQGWCQYGPLDSLELRFKRAYEQDPPPTPRWRIACIFVDRRHRRTGIARAAIEGAIREISAQGGGLVEAIPETTFNRQAQDRFLFSGTMELLEQFGFKRIRQVGMHAWIMQRRVRATAKSD